MKDEFKKVELELNSAKDAINDQLSLLSKSLAELEQVISTAAISRDTRRDELQNLRTNSQKQETELAELKQQQQQLNREVTSLKEALTAIGDDVNSLGAQKNSLEAEISAKEMKAQELSDTIASLTSDIAEVKDKLVNAEKLYEEKVASIEREINEMTDKSNIKLNQYRILQHLLEDNYVPDLEYNVIKVLKQPGVSTFNQVVLSSGVAQNTVREVLSDLSTKGYLDFDESSGDFTILREISV